MALASAQGRARARGTHCEPRAGPNAQYAGQTRALARLSGEVGSRRNGLLRALSTAHARCGSEEGWTAIFQALRDSKVSNISTWDLHEEIGIKESVNVLAEYISVSASLTQLDLGGNNLGAEGAKALASALRNSEGCKLKKLNADVSSYKDPDLVAACKLRRIELT